MAENKTETWWKRGKKEEGGEPREWEMLIRRSGAPAAMAGLHQRESLSFQPQKRELFFSISITTLTLPIFLSFSEKHK